MSPIPKIRIFISSPGDVGREREATRRVIDRLQSEFAEHVTLDPYFWEWEPVDFSHDYQSQIPSTADFDIVICLLWSKLGSRLGEQYKLPPDGEETASSGTQYELMQALHGKQQHPQGLPDLLVWVNKAPPPPVSAPPLTYDQEDELIRQRRALQNFLASITRDSGTGIFTAAVNRYQVPGDDFGSYQYLDEFEDMMDRKLRKLIQKHIGERTVKPKPQWQGSPFRDLDVFDFEHERIFFGRSRAIGEVVRLLQNTLNKPEPCHFALVLGASGSGKSSLARAGVLPMLTRPGVIEGIGLWRCAIVRPSDDSNDLFLALASALLRVQSVIPGRCPAALPELADPEADDPQQALGAELRAHPQSVAIRVKDQLNSIAKAHRTQQSHALEAQIASLTKEGRQADATLKLEALQQLQDPKARLVLLLDQMEELFTLNYAPEQLRAFLETIDVLARSGRVFVIATLRSDFYHRFQNPIPTDQKTLTTLVDLARDGARFDLLPPTPDEISQIIRRPASLAGLDFEQHPTIAEHTLADTLRDEALADTEALPLLEHVLNRLYQAQLPRADGHLTFADHTTLGGVGGALGKHAEDIFTGQNLQPTDPPPPWTEDTFRAVFSCLVTFGKGEGDTDVPNRRAFTYDDLIQSDPAAQALVDTLIHERLLIADKDAQSRPIVRLSHEALLTRWPRLSQWLQTAPVRDLMSQRRRLESSLRQWQEQNHTPDCYLQPGFELEEGKQLLEKHEGALKPEEREFIKASLAYHLEREKKSMNRRRQVVAGLSTLTIIALLGAWYGQWQASRAKQSESVATTQAENARAAAAEADKQREVTQNALVESNRQLERSQLEEGRNWLERSRGALVRDDHARALLFAGRAVGYRGYGIESSAVTASARKKDTAVTDFLDLVLERPSEPMHLSFNPLLGVKMMDDAEERERVKETQELWKFIDDIQPTYLPFWAAANYGGLSCAAISPDGTIIASGAYHHSIKLWQLATGKMIKDIRVHTEPLASLAFSFDGTRIASGSKDKTIRITEVASGRRLLTLKGHLGSVTCVAFSPDGSRLASCSHDGTFKLWDAYTGSVLASTEDFMPHPAGSVSFSPDGTLYAGAVVDGIRIWHAESGDEYKRIRGTEIRADCLAFSPDGSRIATASGKYIRIFEVATGNQVAKFEGDFGNYQDVRCITFSPDGYRIAVECDGAARILDSFTGKQLANLEHGGEVNSLGFSPDGSRFASCTGKSIMLWEVGSNKELSRFRGWSEATSSTSFNLDGSIVAGVSGEIITLWDTSTGVCIASFQGHSEPIYDLEFSPTDFRLLSSSNKSIKLWNTLTGKEILQIEEQRGSTDLLAFSPKGDRFTGGSKPIKLWDSESGKLLASLDRQEAVDSIIFSPDGTLIATESSNTIKLSDALTGIQLRSFDGHRDTVSTLAFNPAGNLLAVGYYKGTIIIWDVATGADLATFRGHSDDDGVRMVAFSPDGRHLVSHPRSFNSPIKIWDINGRNIGISRPEEYVAALSWLRGIYYPGSSNGLRFERSISRQICFHIERVTQTLDLAAPLRNGLVAFSGRDIVYPEISQTTTMAHLRPDTLAQLAQPTLTPLRRAELKMELCTKSGQFRAATALWQRLLQGEWPSFEGATVPKDQAPTTIPADSPIRRLYLLALIDATKHPQIHGHPTICQTAAQIAPVLTKEMMTTPTISLAMMSLMQTLAKDDSPDMNAPRAELLKRLEEVASTEWLAVLRESTSAR